MPVTGVADRVLEVMPPCLPPDRMRGTVDACVGAALRLAGIVHLEDPAESAVLLNTLTADQMLLLPVVLAAMVDIDRTPGELLGWLGYRPPERLRRVAAVAPPSVLLGWRRKRVHDAECGTASGARSHRRRREPLCAECVIADRVWRRTAVQDELPFGERDAAA